jgi:hypothetical protein
MGWKRGATGREGDRIATRWSPQPDDKNTDRINRYHDMREEHHQLTARQLFLVLYSVI